MVNPQKTIPSGNKTTIALRKSSMEKENVLYDERSRFVVPGITRKNGDESYLDLF